MATKILSRITSTPGQTFKVEANRQSDNRFVDMWLATFEAARAKRAA